MGGYGSGRYAAGYEKGKQVVEQYPTVDIKQFKNYLTKSRKAEPINKMDENVVVLKEVVVDPEETFIYIVFKGKENLIHIDQTPCNYGGWRNWFLCPGCDKRVGKLYHGKEGFACRSCYDLNYLSQQYTKTDCYYYKVRAERIAKRVDNFYEMDWLRPKFPHKPKYMKYMIYWRLRKKFDDYIEKSHIVWISGLRSKLNL